MTPEFWFPRLLKELEAKRPTYDVLDAYYKGEQDVPVASNKAVRDAYRRLMSMSRTNFAELVVEAVRERMMPQGFRTGAESDDTGDTEAWRIWQANSLDADVDLLFTPQLSMGAAFAIVGPVDDEIDAPVITPEDPRQVICAYDPIRRRKVVAALKIYRDDVRGAEVAYIYTPGRVDRVARDSAADDMPIRMDVEGFAADGPVQELPASMANMVPVVPFLNRPDRWHCTTSEIQSHLGILDRIGYTVLQRVEVATLQAFKQRAIKGGQEMPATDENGDDIDYDAMFSSDPGALWLLPQTAEMWESGAVDLGPIRAAVRDDVQDLAAVTRTPLYYLTPDSANGSAEGASLAKEGLVFKTRDRMAKAGESLEQVMSLAFLFAGDTERASRGTMETIWYPPERYSLSEKADAATKAIAAGVPWRTVMLTIMQYSTIEVDRMAAERTGDALLAASLAPVAPGGV